jgi:hypothetical protein
LPVWASFGGAVAAIGPRRRLDIRAGSVFDRFELAVAGEKGRLVVVAAQEVAAQEIAPGRVHLGDAPPADDTAHRTVEMSRVPP